MATTAHFACDRSRVAGETPGAALGVTPGTRNWPSGAPPEPSVVVPPAALVSSNATQPAASGSVASVPATDASSVVAAPTKVIYLQPLGGTLPESELAYVAQAVKSYFPFPIRLLPIAELPSGAYHAPRKRYRAERLLDYLEHQTPEDAQVMVGLTEVDISTTKGEVYDWGILGLATLSGRQCVISRFRATRGASSPEQIKARLGKTVVHEIGHTIGLPHCSNYGCIMEDGKGSVLTTDHERDICADCRAKAGNWMLPPPSHLPW